MQVFLGITVSIGQGSRTVRMAIEPGHSRLPGPRAAQLHRTPQLRLLK